MTTARHTRGFVRRHIVWLLAGSGVLMAVPLTVVALWLLMPGWFRAFAMDHCPSLELAWRAAESDGGHGSLTSRLHERFPHGPLLHLLAGRVEHGTAEQQAYAARHLGWMLYTERKPYAYVVVDDPALRQRLIDALSVMTTRGEPHGIDVACFALLAMGESGRLHEFLRLLDRPSSVRWLTQMHLRRFPDDQVVTDHLLKWFAARPGTDLLGLLTERNDPRVEDLLVGILRSSSNRSLTSLRRYALDTKHPPSPARLAAARALCGDRDYDVRTRAITLLCKHPEALELVLDVRCDPAAAASHKDAEDHLGLHAERLSIEQGNRWIAAPALTAGRRP